MSAPEPVTSGAPAEDLQDLYAEARELQTAGQGGGPGGPVAPGAPGAQPEVPAPTNAEVIGGMLAFARDTFCAVTGYRSPKEHLGEREVANLSALWGTVCDRRGINLAALQGEHFDLIAAVAATVPIALALRSGMRVEMAERIKAMQAEVGDGTPQIEPAPPVQPPAPGQATTWDGELRVAP